VSAPAGPRTTAPANLSASYGPVEVAQLVALSLMWGMSFLFIELALAELGPLWIVAGRTTVGGLVLLVILLLRGKRLPNTLSLWGRLLVLGLINNAAPWTLLAWAQQTLPSGLAGLLMAIVPTSTLLVSAAVGLERITPRRVIGLVLALGGVAAIVAGDLEQPGRIVAVLAVVVATLGYAVGAVFAKSRVSGSAPPLVLATGQVLTAAAVTIPIAWIIEGGGPGLASLSLLPAVSILLLGTFGTGLAFLVFYSLVAKVGATNATLTTYLIPVVAVLAGVLFLDERLAATAVGGGVLILIGIWLAQRTPAPVKTPR